MTALHTTGIDLSHFTDSDQQRLITVLGELQPVWREILLDALKQVDALTVRDWLRTEKLYEWVQQGCSILTQKGKRQAQRTSAFFAATPTILPVLTRGELGEWIRLGLELEGADHPEVFAALPDSFHDLQESERLSCYRLIRTAAYHSPQAALALYYSLPRACQLIPATRRGLLLRCIQAAVTFDPTPLPVAVSLLSATLHNLPAESCASVLERIVHLAQFFPAGVARLFRVLGRAYDEVGEAGVLAWIAAGEEIARRNPEAGEAFFALESRTSLLTLRGASPSVMLSDIHGVLLKYLHMLSGAALSLAETESLSFPPPLAAGLEDALPLPVWIEVFPTYEENFRLYRVIAAHQAGRVEFGTYDIALPELWSSFPPFIHRLAGPAASPPDDLLSFFRLFPRPEQIEALFLFLEGRRVAALLASTYRGLQEDLTWAESLTHLFPASLSVVLHRLPTALLPELGADATASDSLLLATELYGSFLYEAPSSAAPAPPRSQPEQVEELAEEEAAMFVPVEEAEEGGSGGTSLSAEEQAMLRKIISRLRAHQKGKKKPQRKEGTTTVLDLFGSPEELGEEEEFQPTPKRATDRRVLTEAGVRYVYDEWDYLIDDYRTQWCHLREIPLSGDEGAFFSSTLAAYGDLTSDIKREFQRLRPRMYRLVKGLEHGEDIDLDAVVAARVDRRTGVSPSTKLYAARQPMERDVSVLFLLDLSASTDMRLPPVSPSDETATPDRGDLRVIDILKEAVVLLSVALEEIGDTYAIYGFSSAGRRNVEVYPVKTFADSLSVDVKGRIGALAPKRSTRMGVAVRHAIRKLKDLSSRAKLLVLLSDGYPEDVDYGRDQHAPTYGIRDTMMALREAERTGILSFCLTVDKGGHDYLREMCAPSRYMVIEDVTALPTELPKIYQRHIRSQQL